MAKVRRETYSCTGRGFSAVDADGYMARLLSFATRPNVHGTTQNITSSTHASDLFTLVGHGYVTGQEVALTLTGDGALPTGGEFTASTSLAYPVSRLNVTPYFIIKLTDDTFQLASTHYNAMAGTPITFADDISGSYVQITALGGGANWYLHDDFSRMAAVDFATTDVDTTAETITVTAHGFSNTHKVTFSSTNTVPGGLTAGTAYWVIRVDANTIKVASSEANAWAGTAINLTSQGAGTHTITTAEHFVILTDTASPALNDYNTSPAGCAPKFLKLGYVNSESGYVRAQYCLWWDNTTHAPQALWSGTLMATYDSAVFAYQFIGGDEFMFQAAVLGSTWDYMLIDTFTGITNKLEVITKVGIVQSGLTAGSSVVVQLDTGEASNFTVDKFYYLYDFDGHSWVDYCKVTARDTVADTVTLDVVSKNYPVGAVLTPYAHRYYTYSPRTSTSTNMNRYGNCVIPYQSGSTASRVLQDSGTNNYGNALFATESLSSDSYLAIGIPDDEGYYDCMRHVVGDYYCPNNTLRSFGSGSADSPNRIYGKSNNVLKTYRDTMGQMINTRTLNAIDYLMFTTSATYCDMITYSESDS
jgi:hypothetical protein